MPTPYRLHSHPQIVAVFGACVLLATSSGSALAQTRTPATEGELKAFEIAVGLLAVAWIAVTAIRERVRFLEIKSMQAERLAKKSEDILKSVIAAVRQPVARPGGPKTAEDLLGHACDVL